MKLFTFLAMFTFLSLGAMAQNNLDIVNNTSCDIFIHTPVYQFTSTGCTTHGNITNRIVPAGTRLSLPAAPAGAEYTYIDGIWPVPGGTSCFFTTLITDGVGGTACTNCNPPWGTISNITLPAGCGSCPPNVTINWDSCSGEVTIDP